MFALVKIRKRKEKKGEEMGLMRPLFEGKVALMCRPLIR